MDTDWDPWDTDHSNLERQRAQRERERRQALQPARGTVSDFGRLGGSDRDLAWDQYSPQGGVADQFTGTVDAEDQLRGLQHMRAPNDFPPRYNGDNPAQEAEGYLKSLKNWLRSTTPEVPNGTDHFASDRGSAQAERCTSA